MNIIDAIDVATSPQTPSLNAANPAGATPSDRPLTLNQVLADMITDKLITKETGEQLLINRRSFQSSQHPLILVGDQKWKDLRDPKKTLHLEHLTQWMADRVRLDYFHIDPFKVDFAAVTKVMSNAYAERFKILPVAVSSSEVTIATAEPFVREWEPQLQQVLRLNIKRVIANPIEIQSYIVEFYNLARSVKTANAQDKGGLSDVTNFEQLMQLGRSGKLDANDSHIIHICDWLFTYAFQQRASDIHIEPRRDTGNVRFRIDGALHQVYQIPAPVMAAMTSRIKIMGRMDVVEKRRPQDGRLKTVSPDGGEVELRLSTMPTAAGKGCLECRMTGYMGRMGIYETMVLSSEVKRHITDTTNLDAFREAAYKDGLKPLRINGAMKIAAGLTTVDEILKIAPPPGGDRRGNGR